MTTINPSYNPFYSPISAAEAFYAPTAPNVSHIPSAPPAPRDAPLTTCIDEQGARDYLTQAGWPEGLQRTFLSNVTKIPIRFMICDNSGSMSSEDGNLLVKLGQKQGMARCSRWKELTSSMAFQIGLAQAAGAVTEFRMLNSSSPIIVGDREQDPTGQNAWEMLHLLEESPSGGTPLCRHIREIASKIEILAPKLLAAKQRAVVVIATDGESSDGNVSAALKPLTNLPVWVVIRLCTNEQRIVKYWNHIDEILELDMDVLDDFSGEASEVHRKNPWLSYGEPMHRLREFGIPLKTIDLLEEKRFSLDQIRSFIALLFGANVNDLPHPEIDLPGFKSAVALQCSLAGNVYNPVHRSMRPWINVEQLSMPSCVIM